MTNKDTGGPAFPLDYETNAAMYGKSFVYAEQGMTLRDYFAAKVCASMVSTINGDGDWCRAQTIAHQKGFGSVSEWFASDSYKQADAMLEARKQ